MDGKDRVYSLHADSHCPLTGVSSLRLPVSAGLPDEQVRALHVWVAFPGAYLALREGTSLSIFASLPKRFSQPRCVRHTVCLAFLVILIISATTGMWKLALARTPAMGLPMPFLFLATLVAAVLMAISSAASVLRTIRAGRGTSGK
jgi:TRAP-type C4-dicarboxylate transport system permease small subunit